jgi:predicted transcriptional regulator
MSDTDNLLIELTAEVVAAYVSNNSVQAANLPELIASVHRSVSGLGLPTIEPAPEPKVNPKRSVFPDYIICLEDGKRFKSLKRHLATHFELTPDEYRSKWKLPRDYPMVAPNYAAARSALAKRTGLGRKAASKVLPKAKAKRLKK